MITESFREHAQSIIDAAYEYETQHQDAGDAYAYLAAEGVFDYDNGAQRLADYMAEEGIDARGVDMDVLAEDCLFWAEMVPGRDYDAKRRFLACSFHIGEIEQQIEAKSIGARFTPWLIDWLNRNTDAFWRFDTSYYAFFYVNCDAYWDCVISKNQIKNCVDELAERAGLEVTL